MLIIRKYHKLQWFDFLDILNQEIATNPKVGVYIELMDEMRMRKIASISEGATYKLKAPAEHLFLKFEQRMKEDSTFCSIDELEELKSLSEFIV